MARPSFDSDLMRNLPGEDLYVQYGCGLSAPESWINFDASPFVRVQNLPIVGYFYQRVLGSNSRFTRFPKNVLYGDIVLGLPLKDQSCQAIYCSHVLEHLSLQELRVALNNTYAYLRTGGVFRFVIPDLENLASEYIHSHDPGAASLFMLNSGLGVVERTRDLIEFIRQYMGNSKHLWMWDFKSIAVELEKTGFRSIRRTAYHESDDLRFIEVEDSVRWENCLGVECLR